MARTISLGTQRFENIRANGYFYVDKTGFVSDWWRTGDDVTLICRPRRFGKTLNLDTVRCFLSRDFAGRGDELFGGLSVWDDSAMRELQGTVPVVSVSFADVKKSTLGEALREIRQILRVGVEAHSYLLASPSVSEGDRAFLARVTDDMDDVTASTCLKRLCAALLAHYGVRPVVLLDECDAPMQQAWTGGFWDGMSDFMRGLMNSTFKTNPALGRGLITGVTRVSRESIFSDLNNLSIVTTSTPLYQTCFGFTEEEVMTSLREFGLEDKAEDVRAWYDGFVFDGVPHIYNPWSVTQFLRYATFDTYWANTSGNALVSSVVRQGDSDLKQDFAILLKGGCVEKLIDEQVVFSELASRPNAIWALLLAAGYLKALGPVPQNLVETPRKLELTNHEVRITFERMVSGWFDEAGSSYNAFVRALLAGDVDAMEAYLADVAEACMSSFDTGTRPGRRSQPERFWHGLVLGLLVDLRGRYDVSSNRESGFGRCDVMLMPNDGTCGRDPAIILEFKVFDAHREGTLEDTVARARQQIEERGYRSALEERGITPDRIHVYGIAFRGKDVLIG